MGAGDPVPEVRPGSHIPTSGKHSYTPYTLSQSVNTLNISTINQLHLSIDN